MGSSSSSESIGVGFKETANAKNVKIVYVWICLRTMFSWYKFRANHWSVILKLSNGQYVCTQKDTDCNVVTQVRNSLREASILTWGDSSIFRLSCYGSCNESWDDFYNSIPIKDLYILFAGDCQNYARGIVNKITNKSVGVWLFEDGPVFKI
ncbi:hypothetical protein ACTFIU_011162 [Dictyostelium citrinum]